MLSSFVCLSVCPSHAGRPIVRKRLNVRSRKQRRTIAHKPMDSSFLLPNISEIFQRGHSN